MTLLGRNILVSTALALSDFISFIISIYLAIALVSITFSQNEYNISGQTEDGLPCIGYWHSAVSGGMACGYAIISIGKHSGLN
jgi:hypothetical protein